MKLKDALALERVIQKKRMEVREDKGHDYASDEECLLNFKVVSKIAELLEVDITRPEGVCIFYIILKIARTCNLLFTRKSKPKNESIWDTTAIDLPNYCDLLTENLINEGILEIPLEIKKQIESMK